MLAPAGLCSGRSIMQELWEAHRNRSITMRQDRNINSFFCLNDHKQNHSLNSDEKLSLTDLCYHAKYATMMESGWRKLPGAASVGKRLVPAHFVPDNGPYVTHRGGMTRIGAQKPEAAQWATMSMRYHRCHRAVRG